MCRNREGAPLLHAYVLRWRALVVIGASLVGLLSVLFLAPATPEAAAPPVVVERAQDGDVVLARIVATHEGAIVDAPSAPQSFTAGSATDTPLGGLGAYLLNATPGGFVNVTLQPWEAFGNYSWDQVVNVSRVHDVARDQRVSQRALERFTGQTATVGERVDLSQWPVVVTAVQSGVATLHADVAVGDVVHRLAYWPSVVVDETDSTVTLRDDASVGMPVDTPADQQGGAASHGNVTAVNETAITVDFNPPAAGLTVEVHAVIVSIKAGSSTLAFLAKLAANQASCESHHAGFVSFQAASDVTPNANGTSWVNVTVGDAWHHELTQTTVSVGNASQAVDALRPGQTQTLSFLVASGAKLPVAIRGDAHFAHGGGAPDDSVYVAQGVANTALRQQAAKVDVKGAAIDTGSITVTWGRWLGWLAFPLMLYPAWEGYRVRQARLAGVARGAPWPRWLDLHTMPAVAATIVSFGHGAVLMLDAYRGNTSAGVWTGVIAIALLSGLGGSGLFMARWVPARWKQARAWHAWLTMLVLVLGAAHALLIGSTFKLLR